MKKWLIPAIKREKHHQSPCQISSFLNSVPSELNEINKSETTPQ